MDYSQVLDDVPQFQPFLKNNVLKSEIKNTLLHKSKKEFFGNSRIMQDMFVTLHSRVLQTFFWILFALLRDYLNPKSECTRALVMGQMLKAAGNFPL